MSTPTDGPRRRRVRVTPIVAVVLVLALAAVGVWVLVEHAGGGERNGAGVRATSSAAPDLEVTVEVTVGEGGSAELADGTRVVVPPGAISQDARLTLARSRSGAPAVPKGLMSASPGGPVWIGLDGGDLNGDVVLTLPTTPPPGWPDDLELEPWPAFYDEAAGSWVAEAGSYDADAGTLVLKVGHFSWWNPFSWDYGAIKDSIVQALADMAGAPSGIPPTCDDPPSPEQVTLVAEGEAVADTCLDTDDDGAVVLRLRGTKHYPLLVTWSGHAELLARTEYGLDVTSLDRWLAEQVGITAEQATVLPTGGDAHLQVSPDATAPVLVTVAYDPQLQLVGIVDATTRVLMAVRGAAGVQATAENVWGAFQDTGCFVQHVDDLGRDPAGAGVTIIADCAGGVLRALSKDSSRLLLRLSGAIPKVVGSLVGVVLYAAHTVLAEFWTAQDVLTGKTTGYYTISTPESPPADSGGGPSSPWPTGDNEGPPALWVWFGASFMFPDWVSCDDAGAWCIVGVGREVYVYRVQGLVDAASVPLASTDPAGALTALGLSPQVVSELLRAG